MKLPKYNSGYNTWDQLRSLAISASERKHIIILLLSFYLNVGNYYKINKLKLKVINGNRYSVKLNKVSSIRNKMCDLDAFKTLNGVSPHAFQNYFARVNHSQCTRANTKNIILPKFKSETGKKAFSFQEAKFFDKLTDEMKTET